MLNTLSKDVVVFILSVFLLILFLSAFLIILVFMHQKKGLAFNKKIEDLKVRYENTLLHSQLEVQEQTFQHIAREIHDNIGQKLTLAKLYLNTIAYNDVDKIRSSVQDSLDLITGSIAGLSDLSRSMGTEIVLTNGLVKAIDLELEKIKKTGLFTCSLIINGEEIFMNENAEIITFRVVQECINNFIKHASGTKLSILLEYKKEELTLSIKDNGRGFDVAEKSTGSGIANIRKRAQMLHGKLDIQSNHNGTSIMLHIPVTLNL